MEIKDNIYIEKALKTHLDFMQPESEIIKKNAYKKYNKLVSKSKTLDDKIPQAIATVFKEIYPKRSNLYIMKHAKDFLKQEELINYTDAVQELIKQK